ncbi:MAG TPA: hypothetical protein VFP34_00925 [Microlunatus sp.]|nr:hypothetical protein [Microlunatus sp.]
MVQQVVRLQQEAGNHTASAAVQRWTMPVLTLKSKAELLRDALAGDVVAINELGPADYAAATQDQRFTMIDHITAQGNSRWGRDTTSLRQLWDSFGNGLPEAVMVDNLGRWKKSIAIDISLTDSIAYTRTLRAEFGKEVTAVVSDFLTTNHAFVLSQMASLGIPAQPGALPAAPDAAQTERAEKMTEAAASLAKTQRAQEEVRKKVFVGYRMDPPKPGPMVPGGPGPNMSMIWYPAAFDPTGPPQYDKPPDGGLLNTIVAAPSPLQPYGPVKEKYDASTAKIQTLLHLYPELYAVAREGKSQVTADFAAKDPAAARAELAEHFHRLLADIEKTQAANGSTLDPLDLTPVHSRMMGGYKGAGVKHDWSTPLAQSVIAALVADHQFNEALKALGMQLAAEALFMFAPLAGEAALVLMFAGLAVTGLKAEMSSDRFNALQAAAKSSPTPGTELVPEGAVDEARAIKEADEAALILAAVAVGTAVAAEIIGAIRIRLGNTKAWRQAIGARDSRVEQWKGMSKSERQKVATITGGTNIETGETVSGVNHSGMCAEDDVAAQLGGDPSKIRFSPATRPRTGQEVPVCTRCQGKYGRNQFPPGTKFD